MAHYISQNYRNPWSAWIPEVLAECLISQVSCYLFFKISFNVSRAVFHGDRTNYPIYLCLDFDSEFVPQGAKEDNYLWHNPSGNCGRGAIAPLRIRIKIPLRRAGGLLDAMGWSVRPPYQKIFLKKGQYHLLKAEGER